VSVPGVYDPDADVVRYADGIPEWTHPGLAAELRTLGISHVTVDNDVNLAAVAERQLGSGQDEQGFALLWIDEGLGLALDTDGSLLRGATGIAGEVGYMPVRTDVRDRDGRPADFQGLVGGPAVRALAKTYGLRGRSTAELVSGAVAQRATAFLDELADRIAVGIAVIIAVADPAVVILGGSVGTAGGETLATLVGEATAKVSPLRARVIPSSVGPSPARSGAGHVASRTACDLLIPDHSVITSAQPSLKETS
jgi:predicted NBD/HSP70 family sugar kinase